MVRVHCTAAVRGGGAAVAARRPARRGLFGACSFKALSHSALRTQRTAHMSHYQGEISFKLRPGAATRAFIDLYNAAKTVKRVTTVKSHNAQRGQRTSRMDGHGATTKRIFKFRYLPVF